MTSRDNQAAAQGCPYAARAAAEAKLHIRAVESEQAPKLYTYADVTKSMTPGHPLVVTAEWVKRFLARPHPDLGRAGAVCPFVPGAIAQDTIWLGVAPHGPGDRQAIKDAVVRYRDQFLQLEPKSGDGAMMKAIVVVFPNIDTEDADVIDDVQSELKAHFVDAGLMIGEFHERNEGEGLRNPDFRPLRSPIPSLAIRFMVETDLPFLQRTMYQPELRVSFLKSYLRRMGGTMSKNNFETALAALVAAEIQIRETVQIAATSMSL